MLTDKKTLVIPILLITLGVGWLLTTLGVVPEIDWVLTLGLAVVGILTFVLGGWDKASVVIGPLFIVASCLSILRQTDRLHINTEVPILVITAGVLLLVARLPSIPPPAWLIHDHSQSP
jgi:hypothetical protein